MKELLKILINLAAIAVVCIMVLVAVRYKDTYDYAAMRKKFLKPFSGVQKIINAKKNNLDIEMSPSRLKPLTTIEQEENLRMYMPDVFSDFKQNDWNEFWGIIYLPIEETRDGVMMKRYRTKEETEKTFVEKYGGSFGYLKTDDWTTFWAYVVKVSW
ncbi:MAG: hypothetical protein PHP69_05200 [Candidatus Omnitrophica bacterium]|nr:hypothetical protein [Candidatus Omnitrophota bacterium]MDD5080914.1 hypothetical protein [Candidatus Omnitrophota bacterium]